MNADHLAAWQSVAAALNGERRAAKAEAERLEELAEGQRVALNDAMRVIAEGFFQADVGDEFRRMLGNGIDQEGRKLAQIAYRQRDRAMNAILSVADFHCDDRQTGKCKCGKPTSRCPEYRAIESELATAYKWEMEQTKRMDKGLDHGLRRDHAAARDWIDRHPQHLWHGLPDRSNDAARATRR